MELYKLHRILNRTPKGAFKSMVWERQLKTKKQYADNIVTKRTTGSALRFGVAYDNMKAVKEGRENGTKPAENAGLIGRHWLIKDLISQSDRTGKTLLRVSLANNSKMETEYFLNGRKVNIPSYLTKVGQTIALKDTSRQLGKMKAILEANSARPVPKWLELNRDAQEAKIVAVPAREDIDLPIEETLIVELYSK